MIPVPYKSYPELRAKDPYGEFITDLNLPRVFDVFLRALSSVLPNPQAPYAFGSIKAIGPGAYSKVPQTLMGFSKSGSRQRGYSEQNYPFDLPVEVQIPGMDAFKDSMKGMNFQHALSRALLNWPGASIVPLIRNR